MTFQRMLGPLIVATALAAACGETDDAPRPKVAEVPDAESDVVLRDSAVLTVEAAPLACPPEPTNGAIVPDAGPFPPLRQDVCRDVSLLAMIECIFGGIEETACKTLLAEPKTATCRECVVGPVGGATPVLVTSEGYAKLNVAACVARITEGLAGFSDCGDLVATREACVDIACGRCVALASPMQFDACATAARQGSCKPYAEAATRCLALSAPDDPVAICTAPGSFTNRANDYAHLFCVAAPDAGG